MPSTRSVVLVSCVKSKHAHKAKAKDLYDSTLFRAQRAFAEAFADRWFILSAKYGLLDPDREIEPYEETLKGAPVERKRTWSAQVFAQLKPLITLGDNITVTAGEDYCRYLIPMIEALGNNVSRPLQGLSMGFIPGRLYSLINAERTSETNANSLLKATIRRAPSNSSQSQNRITFSHAVPMRQIDAFYSCLERLGQKTGGPTALEQIAPPLAPKRGVYFFFEDGEFRPNGVTPRVVRVGTHGLHLGSKSTLYGRLRNHRGSNSGSGNHRGSVFRLHVGKALMARDSIECPSWAKNSSAPRETVLLEQMLEKQVSDYIGKMKVLLLDISDEPGPESFRGYIERNSIGLLSESEPASENWLGFWTRNPSIIKSHLWNVNHVSYNLDEDFLGRLSHLIAAQCNASNCRLP